MKPKTIFCDLDETLLNDEKVITPRTLAAIKRSQSLGHIIIPCTGSSYQQQFPRCKDADFDYMITSNGAFIYDLKNNTVIHQNIMTPETSKQFIKDTRNYCTDYFIHTGLTSFHLAKTEKPNLNGVTQIIPHKINYENALALYELMQTLNKKLGLRIANTNLHFDEPSHAKSDDFAFDIINESASKGLGVLKLMQALGIDKKDTVAIGDGLNDIAMFEQVNYKVAMGNALDKVKAQADRIVASNNHDGVAEYLESFSEV